MPPLLPGDATRPPRPLSLSRISPSVPIPSALSLSRSTTSTREHRRAPPRPVSTPRLGDASRGTAAPSSSSPPTHVTPGALHRAHVAVPLLGHRNSPPFDSPAPDHPRPRLRLEWIRCEPPLPLLCSPPPFSPPSPISHRGRELLAAGHGVAVATATAARSRAHHRDQHDRMKP